MCTISTNIIFNYWMLILWRIKRRTNVEHPENASNFAFSYRDRCLRTSILNKSKPSSTRTKNDSINQIHVLVHSINFFRCWLLLQSFFFLVLKFTLIGSPFIQQHCAYLKMAYVFDIFIDYGGFISCIPFLWCFTFQSNHNGTLI